VLIEGQKPVNECPVDVQRLVRGEKVSDDIKARGGLDLASTQDFTALCMEVEYEGVYYVWWKFYLPEARVKSSQNENYRIWAKEGRIVVTPGNATDYNFIRKDIADMYENGVIHSVYYDRFNSSQLIVDLSEMGIPMVKMGQGFMDMSHPTKDVERCLMNRRVQHGMNPIFLWMMSNAEVKVNENQDVKIVRRNAHKKVDGVIAWIMAHKANIDKMHEYTEGPSIFFI
jgi:phage terminase large subunit-like protein